ncbi:MAG TPA: gamma-glutamyl-gamma-aminobutyrate hydrolase family protein [Planctomycetota bacterium]
MFAAENAPLIGLTIEVLEPPVYAGRRRYQLFTDYLDCLRDAGAVPILLPADAHADEMARWLDVIDGLLLTGGDDVDLRPLGGPAPTTDCKPVPASKQETDLDLVRAALERKMPLFGVCLGMQMLGLAHGAAYEQHLAGAAAHTKGVEHTVQAVAGSRLAGLVGAEPFAVPSFHHQALVSAGPGLAAGAFAADGVLEAVEVPDRSFAIGVQWHPERHKDSTATRALFSSFVAAARAYRESSR